MVRVFSVPLFRYLALLSVLISTPCAGSDPDYNEPVYLDSLTSNKPGLVNKALRELGAHQSAAGLKAVLDNPDSRLFAQYESAVPRGNGAVLGAELQKAVISRFGDLSTREQLVTLLNDRKYDDPRLFNLIYPLALHHEVLLGRLQWIHILLANAVPDIEPQVAALYPKATETQRLAILGFLSERVHEPSLNLFLQAREQFGYTDSMSHIHWLLARMQTPRAASTLIRILSSYHDDLPTEVHYKMVISALGELERIPRHVAVDQRALVQAVPYKTQPQIARAWLSLITARGIKQAAEDVYPWLRDPQLHREAFDAIMAMESPDIARQALQQIDKAAEQGVFDKLVYRHYSQALSDFQRDYDKIVAHRKDQRVQARVRGDMHRIRQKYQNTRRSVPDTGVEAHVATYRRYLQELEQLDRGNPRSKRNDPLTREIFEGYTYLGQVLRDLLHDPRGAIQSHTTAIRVASGDQGLDSSFNNLLMAEIYLFDLKDKESAATSYARFRDTVGNSAGQDFGDWTRNWLDAMLAWLRDGRNFEGSVSRDDLGSFGLAATLLPGIVRISDHRLNLDDEDALARLREMPRSHLLIPLYLDLTGMAPAQEIARLINEADPSGFWRAHLLGLVEYDQYRRELKRPPPETGDTMRLARAVVQRLQRDQLVEVLAAYKGQARISFHFDARAEYASPEQTFQRFRAALQSNNIDQALNCFTPDQRSMMRSRLRTLSAEQRSRMGSDYQLGAAALDMGRYREYQLINNNPNNAGTVMFLNSGGEWKINQF